MVQVHVTFWSRGVKAHNERCLWMRRDASALGILESRGKAYQQTWLVLHCRG